MFIRDNIHRLLGCAVLRTPIQMRISARDCRWELEVTELSGLRKEWTKLCLYEAGQGDKQAMIWRGEGGLINWTIRVIALLAEPSQGLWHENDHQSHSISPSNRYSPSWGFMTVVAAYYNNSQTWRHTKPVCCFVVLLLMSKISKNKDIACRWPYLASLHER